jgi:putative transcriptional regulator
MSIFGKELLESAHDALAIAQGKAEPARAVAIEAIDVAAIRNRLGLTQDRFAKRFALSVATVRDWEQGRRQPDRIAQSLLRIIEYAPETAERALRK